MIEFAHEVHPALIRYEGRRDLGQWVKAAQKFQGMCVFILNFENVIKQSLFHSVLLSLPPFIGLIG